MDIQIGLYLTFVSVILTLFVILMTLRIKEKQWLHYSFLGAIISCLFIEVGVIIEYLFPEHLQLGLNIDAIGRSLVSPFFLLSGYFFSNVEKEFKKKYLTLFILPVLSIIFTYTNTIHHLMFVNYSINTTDMVRGSFGIIHNIYVYIFMLIGFYFFLSFSIKDAGLFSKQALLIIVAALIPIAFSLSTIAGIFAGYGFYIPIALAFSMAILGVSITRYSFLNIVPIALLEVVNLISDGFLVLSRDYMLLEYNNAASLIFKESLTFKKQKTVINELANIGLSSEKLKQLINEASDGNKKTAYETNIAIDGQVKYFIIEITPIYLKKSCIAVILLFKDLTEQKIYTEALEQNNRLLDAANRDLQDKYFSIEELNKELRGEIDIDGLTGIYNRKFFNEFYKIELERAINQVTYSRGRDTTANFSIAILDIDNFKRINDTYGHQVGDMVLQEVANVVKGTIFSRDIVCRYGGEEFVILFIKTEEEKVLDAAEKVRKEIENHVFNFGASEPEGHITISIGVASFENDSEYKKRDLLKIADERLYLAKRNGKNQVVFK